MFTNTVLSPEFNTEKKVINADILMDGEFSAFARFLADGGVGCAAEYYSREPEDFSPESVISLYEIESYIPDYVYGEKEYEIPA